MWEGLVDWSVLIVHGADALIYGALVTSGTLLFFIRLIFELFGSAQRPEVVVKRTGLLRHVTLLSILGFLMGIGWLGLICRAEWGVSPKRSAAVAAAGGVIVFVIAAVLVIVVRGKRREERQEGREQSDGGAVASGERAAETSIRQRK